jgi:hypothetical protein
MFNDDKCGTDGRAEHCVLLIALIVMKYLLLGGDRLTSINHSCWVLIGLYLLIAVLGRFLFLCRH